MLRIRNGKVLLPEGRFETCDVTVADGVVAAVETAAGNGRKGGDEMDASGLLVLPGLVDIHGDAFERQLMPRPGVTFGHGLALLETDRQMTANGITTAYHGLTCSWEPGLRSREAARRFLDELQAVRPRLGCDTRLHVRFENHNLDMADEVEEWIGTGRVGLFSFNDHLDHMLARLDDQDKMSTYLHRTGLGREAFVALLERVRDASADVPALQERLAAAARAAGVPMASHDDPSPGVRQWYRERGSRIADFPVNLETAVSAHEAGDHVVLGAPNVLRGVSHDKRVTAREAVAGGFCDVLTSDYFYPALPQAPFALTREGLAELGAAWRLVSENPARAVGLDDRGSIAPGKRADLVLIDAAHPGLPLVRATLAGGRVVFSCAGTAG